MLHNYTHLTRAQLLESLQRRDLDTPYGLVWERNEIEPEAVINRDYVGLRLDPALSCGAVPWRNLVIEGDNWDALRALAAIEKVLADHAGPATLYTWSPERYAHLPARVLVTVPDALLAAFRRGEAGAARVVARANEAPQESPATGL